MEEGIDRAYDEIGNLKGGLEAAKDCLWDTMNPAGGPETIIGESDAMKYVFFRARQVAAADSSVLLMGETGTGKGLIAGFIHRSSGRRGMPMVTVNCAALPSSLIESELFGREKGAFTDSLTAQAGRFEVADKGTIFLDEIGELPLDLQSKLLRVIETGEFERLGSSRVLKVDIRTIASTNRDLVKEMREGRFREDLYYRLNVFPITMPPLRQRQQDIPLLARYFMRKYCSKMQKNIEGIPPNVMKALENFTWPGNVRELDNVIERAVIVSSGNMLQLSEPLIRAHAVEMRADYRALAEVEREHILAVLRETGWKIEGRTGAAEILGLKPSTLRSRMKKLGISRMRILHKGKTGHAGKNRGIPPH